MPKMNWIIMFYFNKYFLTISIIYEYRFMKNLF